MRGGVQVTAITNPMSERAETWHERDGILISKIFEKIQDRYRRFRKTVQLNGRPLPPSIWDKTRARRGDIVNIKLLPTFGGGIKGTAANLVLGGLSATALYFLTRSGGSSNASSAVQANAQAPPPATIPDPPQPPQDQYGGAKDTIVSPISGVGNRKANFEPWPVPYGKNKMFPPIVADPYFTTVGPDQWCHVVFSPGIGPVDITDVRVDGKPIAQLVAAGVAAYEVREGKVGDNTTPLTLYTRDVNTVKPAEDLPTNTVKQATGGQSSNMLSVDIHFPSGIYGSDHVTYDLVANGLTITGGTGTINGLGGDREVALTCSFTIEYRLTGTSGAWSSFVFNVTDLAHSSKIAGTSWSVATPGVYDVRVTKTSDDAVNNYSDAAIPNPSGAGTITFHHSVTKAQAATWLSLKSIQTKAPVNTIRDAAGNIYPRSLIALKIKGSELVSYQPTLSCIVERWLKTWDGDALTDYVKTRNPAWAFLDVVIGFIGNQRNGITAVDADKILEWATFCDSKGFHYDKSVESFTTTEDLLDEICAHGRASRSTIDGAFTVVIDKERSTMVQLFTQANTNNLEWEADFPEYPHALKIKFRNPSADWNVDERTVYADGYDANNATQFESYDFAGLIEATPAWMHGRYLLAAAEQRPIRYSFDIDAQHLLSRRGDRVGLNYDVSFDGLGSGTVSSVIDDGVNVTGVTISQSVVMVADTTYGVQIRLSDGVTIITKQVNTVPGESRQLDFVVPISLAGSIPEYGNTSSFGLLGQESTQCVIESIEHSEADLSAHVVLVDYSPNIFLADQGEIPDFTANVSLRHAAQLPDVIAPTTIGDPISDERALLRGAGGYVSRIQISLTAPISQNTLAGIETQYRETGTEQWFNNFSGPASANVVYIVGVTDKKTYDTRLRYKSSLFAGLFSDWTYVNSHYVVGMSTLPPDVLTVWIGDDRVHLKYDAQGGIDVPIDWVGFEWRWAQAETAAWDDMKVLYVGPEFSVDLGALPPGALVLAVKAVDAAGNRSANAAYVIRNITGTLMKNQFLEFLESPGWTGTKTNFTQIGNELKADSNGSAFYGPGGSPFYSGDPASDFYEPGWLDAQYQWSYTPSNSIAKPFRIVPKITDDGTPEGAPLIDAAIYFVEYKRGSQALFYNQDANAPFYSAVGSDLFYPEDPAAGVWLPFPQEGIEGNYEKYDFRITAIASRQRPVLKEGIGVMIDVPDVTEYADMIVDPAGSDVPLTKTYREIRQVSININFDVAYPDVVKCDYEIVSASRVVIRAYNAAGTQVAASIRVDIRGV